MVELYREWIDFLFDRSATPNGWYFDVDPPPFEAEENPEKLTQLVIETCTNAGDDLLHYSDQQVAYGLNYIFNGSCSNVAYQLRSQTLSFATRIQCIAASYELYEKCFQVRCAKALGHLNEGTDNPLNTFCYMLWDNTPLAYWENDPQAAAFYTGIIKVLENVLQLPHEACIESALHGLGHLQMNASSAVESTIRAWLKQSSSRRPELIQYAHAAMKGCVQ